MENLPPPESVHELITYDCRWLNFNASCQRKILSLEFADICKCHANCENGSCNNDSDTDDEEIKEWQFMTLFWIYSIYLKNSYFSCFTNIPIISREMLQNTSNFAQMIPANSDSYDTNSWIGFIINKNLRILSIIKKVLIFADISKNFIFLKKIYFINLMHQSWLLAVPNFPEICWVCIELWPFYYFQFTAYVKNCMFFMFYLNLNNVMKNVANHFKFWTHAPWYI